MSFGVAVDPESDAAYTRIAVAKPHHLQRTPFDGYEADRTTPNGVTFIVRGTEYRYKYFDEDIDFRFKELVGGQGSVEDQLAQEFTPAYFAGDILTAGKYKPERTDERTTTQDGDQVLFVDVNSAGRRCRPGVSCFACDGDKCGRSIWLHLR